MIREVRIRFRDGGPTRSVKVDSWGNEGGAFSYRETQGSIVVVPYDLISEITIGKEEQP